MKKLFNESLRKDLPQILSNATNVNRKGFDTSHSIDVTFPNNVCPDSYLYVSETNRDNDFVILEGLFKEAKKD